MTILLNDGIPTGTLSNGLEIPELTVSDSSSVYEALNGFTNSEQAEPSEDGAFVAIMGYIDGADVVVAIYQITLAGDDDFYDSPYKGWWLVKQIPHLDAFDTPPTL